jgi:hypothetical protein
MKLERLLWGLIALGCALFALHTHYEGLLLFPMFLLVALYSPLVAPLFLGYKTETQPAKGFSFFGGLTLFFLALGCMLWMLDMQGQKTLLLLGYCTTPLTFIVALIKFSKTKGGMSRYYSNMMQRCLVMLPLVFVITHYTPQLSSHAKDRAMFVSVNDSLVKRDNTVIRDSIMLLTTNIEKTVAKDTSLKEVLEVTGVLNQYSDSIMTLIQRTKVTLASKAGELPNYTDDSLVHLKNMGEHKEASDIMLGRNGRPSEAAKLQTYLYRYHRIVSFLLSHQARGMEPITAKDTVGIDRGLSTEDHKWEKEEKPESWASYEFGSAPLLWTMVNLTKLQHNVRECQLHILTLYYSHTPIAGQ